VLLTTDGLNEAFNADAVQYGFDRIAETLKRLAPEGTRAIIDELQRSVADWEGALRPEDDKTLVVIGRAAVNSTKAPGDNVPVQSQLPPPLSTLWTTRSTGNVLSAPAELDAINDLGCRLGQCDGLKKLPATEFGLIEQGLYEILSNVIEHGCLLDSSKSIDVWWFAGHPDPGSGVFLVRDHGTPQKPERWAPLPEDHKSGRGYGLQLIEQTLSDVKYFPSTPDGNVTMVTVAIPRREE
jgi:anti-sigma regulatory factor (Ser/Thr protein kinase)